jgi:NNP family nitrate/nitrite transporter-like MFS transporter
MVSTWLQGSSLRIIAIIVLYNMSLMGAMAMMPLYLQESFALTPAQTGFVFAIIWTVGALAQPLLGHLSDLTGRKTVSIVGLLLASVFFVAAIFASNLIGLVVVLVLSMGALVGIRAVLLAAMVDVSGKRESTTLGFAFAVMDGVGALGAVFAGIAGQYDLRYAFAFSAVMAASAMALTVLHKFSKAG